MINRGNNRAKAQINEVEVKYVIMDKATDVTRLVRLTYMILNASTGRYPLF